MNPIDIPDTQTDLNSSLKSTIVSPTELMPRYWISIALVIGSLPLLWVQPWVALGISIFGLFLTYQAVSLRLQFTETALDIYRGNSENRVNRIRTFPYKDWQNWRIFWLPFPVLFYFREVNSIHFLPMLFEARKLQACLEKFVPLSSLRERI